MQRFKKYIGKEFIFENVKNKERLQSSGLICKSMPDSLGDFEEIELCTDFDGREITLCVAVLEGKLKRIMFVLVDKDDPDIVQPLTEAQLNDFLNRKGEQLVGFFEYITK